MSETLPIIKLKSGKTVSMKGMEQAATAGLGSIFSSGSIAADLMPHDTAGLMQMLHVRLYEQDRAKQRSKNLLGRFYNRGAGADPDYIEVSGSHLKQIMELCGTNLPDGVANASGFLLHNETAREAYDMLKAELEK